MDAAMETALGQVLDRQAISDCFLRYTRGVDRVDVDLIKSAFHPDAIDNHTRNIRGSVDGMLAWWLPQQEGRESAHHYVSNQTIDLDGDVAHVETYFFVVIKLLGQTDATMGGGRYADRFEKRDGVWKIALRVVLSEWRVTADASAMTALHQAAIPVGARGPGDITYQRPLEDPRLTV